MLNSANGAVFNVIQVIAKAVLGVPPIATLNKINSIKHLLKLNINKAIETDPLANFVDNHLLSNSYSSLTARIKEVYQFLNLKKSRLPESFTQKDLEVVENWILTSYSDLSPRCCSYSKRLMREYLEQLWQVTLNSHFQSDGFKEAPTVSTQKLKFPSNTSRESETLLLSLFYPNNLLNEFLFRYDSTKFRSPLCYCLTGEQNSKHLIIYCPLIDSNIRKQMNEIITSNPKFHYLEPNYGSNPFFISWSRKPEFMGLCLKINESSKSFLRVEVTL